MKSFVFIPLMAALCCVCMHTTAQKTDASPVAVRINVADSARHRTNTNMHRADSTHGIMFRPDSVRRGR